MRTGENLPSVGPEKSVAEAVLEMSAKRMGMTCVTNKMKKSWEFNRRRSQKNNLSWNRYT